MIQERIAEIKEIIASVRKCGQVSHEVLKAMDEMMATIESMGNVQAQLYMAESFIGTLPPAMQAAWNRNVALSKLN